MGIGKPSAPLPTIILRPFVAAAIDTALSKIGMMLKPASRVLRIVICYVRLDVAHQCGIVIEMLRNHYVRLFLIQIRKRVRWCRSPR